jgi:hypothetical protein
MLVGRGDCGDQGLRTGHVRIGRAAEHRACRSRSGLQLSGDIAALLVLQQREALDAGWTLKESETRLAAAPEAAARNRKTRFSRAFETVQARITSHSPRVTRRSTSHSANPRAWSRGVRLRFAARHHSPRTRRPRRTACRVARCVVPHAHDPPSFAGWGGRRNWPSIAARRLTFVSGTGGMSWAAWSYQSSLGNAIWSSSRSSCSW